MSETALFESTELGHLTLANRIVMAPLNQTTLYGGGAEGYTDYPTLNG